MTTDRTALEAARDALPPLLRCPFCNMEARWFTAGRDAHGIECSDGEDCPGRAQTNVYGTEHKHCAVDDWNTREGMSPETAAPQEAAPALDDARDAKRYRWVRAKLNGDGYAQEQALIALNAPQIDVAIDAALEVQQEPRS